MSGWIDEDKEKKMPDEVSYGEVADMARNAVMDVFFYGERHGKTGWQNNSATFHVMRAGIHIVRWLAGDFGEDNLTHAITRISMAIWIMKHGHKVVLSDNEFSEGGAY